MFNESEEYHVNNPIRINVNVDGAKKVRLYKVKAHADKPYHIRVDEYENEVFFIKFYPARLITHKDKYKVRVNKSAASTGGMTRLVSSCISIAKRIKMNQPEATFAFTGQWDNNDLKKSRSTSQRYNIYKRVIASKITTGYVHGKEEKHNTYYVVPESKYTPEFEDLLFAQFDDLFGDSLRELAIPEQ